MDKTVCTHCYGRNRAKQKGMEALLLHIIVFFMLNRDRRRIGRFIICTYGHECMTDIICRFIAFRNSEKNILSK
ncbi:MAG: hypothetical protein ISS94_03860 [Candidatus Syntrophoarchaeum sp.]|nr:hypothetical protein [Candidatus Syntrophoarchaeum sp.]